MTAVHMTGLEEGGSAAVVATGDAAAGDVAVIGAAVVVGFRTGVA